MNEKEILIQTVLNEIGISRNYKGYNYIFYGLILLLDGEAVLTSITKSLYGKIAEKYNTRPANVERNIRTVKDGVWSRNGKHPIFRGCHVWPNNGEFMESLLSEVERRMR